VLPLIAGRQAGRRAGVQACRRAGVQARRQAVQGYLGEGLSFGHGVVGRSGIRVTSNGTFLLSLMPGCCIPRYTTCSAAAPRCYIYCIIIFL
jgi:hypothetical protein